MTTADQLPELLPCPFCGKPAKFEDGGFNAIRVACSDFDCEQRRRVHKRDKNCHGKLAAHWNTRAAVTAPRGDMLNTLKLIATTLHEQIHNYRPVGDCLAFPCNKANAAIHAAGTTDNSQTDHQVSDQRVKLLLRYADHLSGCTSYTNGPCTCGFESAMQELADRGTAATSSPTPAAPSVVDAIAELIKMRDEYADDERVTRPVNTLNAAIERLAFANSNATPPERTRVEGEQWRQGMKDAAKEVCDACENEERYGPVHKVQGSTRWWHGDDNIPCEAGGIWHVLAERTTNAAAAPADNDAE